MVRGRRLKAQAGNVILNGAPPFGYMQANDGGKKTLAIDEEEAAVVRMVFDWYTGDDRLSIRAIAQRLSTLCIPTSSDRGKGRGKNRGTIKAFGQWGTSTIARILTNETYAGTWHYSKYADDPERLIAVEVPAVVSQETFQQAQARRKQNKDDAPLNVKHNYLLRRRVFCGECGSAMAVVFSRSKNKHFCYYKCYVPYDRVHYARTCNQGLGFRADAVDTLVWEWVKSNLSDPTQIAEGLRAHEDEREHQDKPLRDRLLIVDKLIADNRGQLNRLIDLYLTGDFPKEALLERKTRLTDVISALEREREGVATQLTAQRLTEDEVQSLFDFAAEVAQGLEKADRDFETRRRIVEILDLQVTLAIEEGEKIVYPRCRFWDGERLSIGAMKIDAAAQTVAPTC